MKRPRFTNDELDALLDLLAYASAGTHEDVGMAEEEFDKLPSLAKVGEMLKLRKTKKSRELGIEGNGVL